jgi:hypothetical protein
VENGSVSIGESSVCGNWIICPLLENYVEEYQAIWGFEETHRFTFISFLFFIFYCQFRFKISKSAI